jgi:SpoVK/Ycf46/Vps4 family AAA+-type ATPase
MAFANTKQQGFDFCTCLTDDVIFIPVVSNLKVEHRYVGPKTFFFFFFSATQPKEMNNNDLDSLLMPPPPPRLSKRQKVDVEASVSSSSLLSTRAAAAESIKTGQSTTTPHDSIFLRQQNCTTVDSFNNNSGRGGERSRKGRSVSPDDIDTKIIVTCVDNGSGEGGGNDDNILAKSKSDAFVFGGGEGVKKLEGTFDLASDSNTNTTTTATVTCATHNHHHEFSNDDNNVSSTSQNYDPSAAVVSTAATINNKSDEGKEDEPLSKIDKSQSSQHGYDIPPITTSFRDIIGHGQAKLRLDEALLPLALPPDLADSVLSGIRAAPASILLHGPPGCGKTKLAKAVAGEAQASFLSVGPSDILSKFVGESEQSIRGLFREARARAKKMESKCTVVFFDEIDALGRSRVDEGSGGESQSGGGDHSSRRVLAELLIQMTALSNAAINGEEDSESDEEEDDYDGYCDDSFTCQSTLSTAGSDGFGRRTTQARNTNDDGMNKVQVKPRVIVVAATNRPEDCDPALLRRFAVRVLVGLPTRKDRKKIIKRLLLDVDHTLTGAQLDELAVATEGWSGSDLGKHHQRALNSSPSHHCTNIFASTFIVT